MCVSHFYKRKTCQFIYEDLTFILLFLTASLLTTFNIPLLEIWGLFSKDVIYTEVSFPHVIYYVFIYSHFTLHFQYPLSNHCCKTQKEVLHLRFTFYIDELKWSLSYLGYLSISYFWIYNSEIGFSSIDYREDCLLNEKFNW